ncbi:hypothetical protein OC844_003975 [Tilletia horrida]|nr:hypothetical protein OC844_003975 [Tilletia horrida]
MSSSSSEVNRGLLDPHNAHRDQHIALLLFLAHQHKHDAVHANEHLNHDAQAIVTPTVIIITPSFSAPTVITTVTTILSTGTATITSTSTPDRSSGGFFDNKGAVGGVFAVVGLIVLLLIAGLIWLILRRRRQKQMDADVMAAASAAAAHSRTPFDYDDEDPEMIEGPNSYPPRVPTPGAATAYGGTVNSYSNYAPEGYEPSHFSAGTGPGYAGMGAYGPTLAAAGAAAGAGAGAYGAYYAGQTHDGSGNDPYSQYNHSEHARQASYGGSTGQNWAGGASAPGSPPMDANAMPNPYSPMGAGAAYVGAGQSPPLAPHGEHGEDLAAGGAGIDASNQYLSAGGALPGGAASSTETGPTAVGTTENGEPKPHGHRDGLDDEEAAHLASGRPDPRFMMNQEQAGSSASLRDDQDYSRRLGL